MMGEHNVISLGLNGHDGSYVRSGLIPNGPVLQFGIGEQDTLRGIFNVEGSNRAETITGNEQANVLTGRGGADVLTGLQGADTFVYRAASDSSPTTFDTITDFQHGVDHLALSALHVHWTSNDTLARGELHVAYDKMSNTTILEANTDTVGSDHHLNIH